MLTLDEAVAWLDKMLELHLKPCGEPDCGECLRDTRAAVRDVALAAGEWFNDPDRDAVSLQPYFRDYILRLLGDSPHG